MPFCIGLLCATAPLWMELATRALTMFTLQRGDVGNSAIGSLLNDEFALPRNLSLHYQRRWNKDFST
ncbi:hypothetical protein DsansV1_C17g0147501 [Dioscorea sansibarensis]